MTIAQASATPLGSLRSKSDAERSWIADLGQPWTVQAYPANMAGTVSVQFLINNTVNRIEAFAPYCPFDGTDDGD